MLLLTQFLFRLAFGLSAAMAATSSRQVTSGYFRVHLYVALGLNVLAALVAWSAPERFDLWPPLAAAVVSYFGSVAWLYEKPRAGRAALMLVAGLSLCGAVLAEAPQRTTNSPVPTVLSALDTVSGGLVLGVTMAAMLLGHWYLNTPTMQLAPLRRLVLLMAAAVVLRAAVCGTGLALEWSANGTPDTARLLFIALRWSAGLILALAVAWLTWATLKVPNTQSATGMLYVGVIVTFLGELTGLLLSRESEFPL